MARVKVACCVWGCGDRFACENGVCVPHSLICDGADDCGDNTDEPVLECLKGQHWPQLFIQFPKGDFKDNFFRVQRCGLQQWFYLYTTWALLRRKPWLRQRGRRIHNRLPTKYTLQKCSVTIVLFFCPMLQVEDTWTPEVGQSNPVFNQKIKRKASLMSCCIFILVHFISLSLPPRRCKQKGLHNVSLCEWDQP